MTLEQILDCSADELEAMTDEQLLKHFEPYLSITRIDRQSAESLKKNAGPVKSSSTARATTKKQAELERAQKIKEIGETLGQDLSFMFK